MLTVERHLRHPNGDVELALRVTGPLPAGALDAAGGTVEHHGDDLVVSWRWTHGMAPIDELDACARHLRRELERWAARYTAGPVHVTDPGTDI
ncbi:hypothetical protein SK069_05735 [Patulibacter brassicae]|uniref:Uncharacterized protein n=1 Tax=Patulibacter brassicae TaxID=1705717 RepID=A0ABU4VJV2_9ACTN|nr:hypothetical protein [Patulibacter brassicae]MDX8151085.1 hypothetical protein [Patulibacter brassicae]